MSQIMFGETAFFVVSNEFVDGTLQKFAVDGHAGVVSTLDEAVAVAELVTVPPYLHTGEEEAPDDEAVIYWLVPVGRARNGGIEHRCGGTHDLLLAASKAARERQR